MTDELPDFRHLTQDEVEAWWRRTRKRLKQRIDAEEPGWGMFDNTDLDTMDSFVFQSRLIDEDSPDKEHARTRAFLLTFSAYCQLLIKKTEKELQREQSGEGGKRSKRRKWADRAAELVSTWDDLPESRNAYEFDDLMVNVYRDGNTLCAADMYNSDAEPKTLARSTFERRYLKK